MFTKAAIINQVMFFGYNRIVTISLMLTPAFGQSKERSLPYSPIHRFAGNGEGQLGAEG